MCCICGFLHVPGLPVDEQVGRRMMNLLRHRGPDGDGSLVVRGGPGGGPGGEGASLFLGHRRLKIIDLSVEADQPMPNEDRTMWPDSSATPARGAGVADRR